MPQVPSLEAFEALEKRLAEALLRLDKLEARQIGWVREEEAQQLTGLSHATLARERKKPDTLLVFKKTGGLRYLRQSVLDFNEARLIRRQQLL
jgi:hypothetical protein